MVDILHMIFGNHVADPDCNHWRQGQFVSSCMRCGREMTKLPGLPWALSSARKSQ